MGSKWDDLIELLLDKVKEAVQSDMITDSQSWATVLEKVVYAEKSKRG